MGRRHLLRVISIFDFIMVSFREIGKLNKHTYAYRANPGATSFALANAASSLPIKNLPLGEYIFRITATSNGITKNLSETIFQPGNYSADVDEELTQKVLGFIGQNGSGTFFTTAHVNTALGKMGFQEILIMAVNSRNNWLWGTVGQIFEENHQNPYLIELYENEILDLICEMHPGTILIENPEAEFMSWTKSLVKGFRIGLTDYQDKLGGLFEEDIKQLNKTLGKFNDALGGIKMTVDFANSIAKAMQNYENGLLILNQIAETVDSDSNPELATAIDRVRAKFKSETFNVLINAIELETKEILKAGVGEVAKALASCASKFDATMNGGVLYSIFNLAIDVTMKLTGGDEIAKDYQTFMIQVNNYTTGIDAYSIARNALLTGEASNETINRFVCAFTYAKQAALRTHNTILKLEGTTSSERERIREYISELESVSFQ